MVHCRTKNSRPVSRAGGYERLAQGNTRPSQSHPLLRRSALSLRICAGQCALLIALLVTPLLICLSLFFRASTACFEIVPAVGCPHV